MAGLWYEKYRPDSLEDYVWRDEDRQKRINSWLAKPEDFPNIILSGPTGTGKTTLALLMKDALGVESADFLFVDASRKSGAETIRNEVTNFCEIAGWSGLKIVLFDEAERLTRDAQEMLRNTMDMYGKYVRFIFTCNEPRRILDPIKSRCLTEAIDALDESTFVGRLYEIVEAEGIDITEGNVDYLVKIMEIHYPNMRAAINTLQDSCRSGDLVDPNEANKQADWETSVHDLFQNPNKATVAKIREVVSSIRPEEIESVYRTLYENSSVFGKEEDIAIITIADHLFQHQQVSFGEINLSSCLIKLVRIRKETDE